MGDEDLFGSEAIVRPDSKNTAGINKMTADMYYTKIPNDNGVKGSNSYRPRYSNSLDHDKFLAAITTEQNNNTVDNNQQNNSNNNNNNNNNNNQNSQPQLRIWQADNE